MQTFENILSCDTMHDATRLNRIAIGFILSLPGCHQSNYKENKERFGYIPAERDHDGRVLEMNLSPFI